MDSSVDQPNGNVRLRAAIENLAPVGSAAPWQIHVLLDAVLSFAVANEDAELEKAVKMEMASIRVQIDKATEQGASDKTEH